MKRFVVNQPAVPASASPYRVRDEKGGEAEWSDVLFLRPYLLHALPPAPMRHGFAPGRSSAGAMGVADHANISEAG
jgi:hypothetical protein